MPELLIELASEEIPARMQAQAAEELSRGVCERLGAAGVVFAKAAAYSTPRRLTLHVGEIALETEATREEFKGPRADAPAKALDGFLRKVGLKKDQLELRDDKKGQTYFAVVERPGRQTAALLAEIMPDVVRAFSWPKSMRWGDGDLRWVRPLRSVLCILVDNPSAKAPTVVVPQFEIDGLVNDDIAYGHRVHSLDRKTGAPKPLKIKSFKDYKAQLKRAKVMLDPEERRAKIEKDATALAAEAGLELVPDAGLLREVAGLVEHPVALMGAIDPAYLSLPAEVLRTSMKEHQKFFSVREPKTGRIVSFVTIANLEAADGGATIVAGNERVLRARLADAAFFYQNDLAKPLEAGVEKLAAVTFHNQLGSQADRVARIRGLARELAPLVSADPDLADRAALLAKADLVSEMVYEFPELQGYMGRVYAEAAKEPATVAAAIESHYAPLGPSDDAPTEPVAIAVALADKLDALAGFWTIGAKPTGSGDPFALRRAALGVIRIVLENGLRLRLERSLSGHAARLNPDVVAVARRGEETVAEGPAKTMDDWRQAMRDEIAAGAMARSDAGEAERLVIARRLFDGDIRADLIGFIAERLKVYLRDPKTGAKGVRHDVIDAVFALGGVDDLTRTHTRITALAALLETDDGANLIAAYKRANNILEAEEKKDGVEYSLDPNPKLAEEDAERALFSALDAADESIKGLLKAEDYAGAMTEMASLRPPLDAFFDKVVVNAENQVVRRNRLCLLHRIRKTMGQVADFSLLEG